MLSALETLEDVWKVLISQADPSTRTQLGSYVEKFSGFRKSIERSPNKEHTIGVMKAFLKDHFFYGYNRFVVLIFYKMTLNYYMHLMSDGVYGNLTKFCNKKGKYPKYFKGVQDLCNYWYVTTEIDLQQIFADIRKGASKWKYRGKIKDPFSKELGELEENATKYEITWKTMVAIESFIAAVKEFFGGSIPLDCCSGKYEQNETLAQWICKWADMMRKDPDFIRKRFPTYPEQNVLPVSVKPPAVAQAKQTYNWDEVIKDMQQQAQADTEKFRAELEKQISEHHAEKKKCIKMINITKDVRRITEALKAEFATVEAEMKEQEKKEIEAIDKQIEIEMERIRAQNVVDMTEPNTDVFDKRIEELKSEIEQEKAEIAEIERQIAQKVDKCAHAELEIMDWVKKARLLAYNQAQHVASETAVLRRIGNSRGVTTGAVRSLPDVTRMFSTGRLQELVDQIEKDWNAVLATF